MSIVKGDIDTIFAVAAQGFERQISREHSIGAYSFLPEKKQMEHYLSAQMMKEGIVSLLWRNDRMGMTHSIESRFPFLDEDVMKFAMNLPTKYKIGRSNTLHNYKHPFLIDKFIVRKVGERHLPRTLTDKKKKGFPVVGLRNIHAKSEFFDDGFVREILGINNEQFNYMVKKYPTYFIGKFLALEIWAKLFILKEKQDDVNRSVSQFVTISA